MNDLRMPSLQPIPSKSVNVHIEAEERYIKYSTQCLFFPKDYLTEDKILDFEDFDKFEKKSLQNTPDNEVLS